MEKNEQDRPKMDRIDKNIQKYKDKIAKIEHKIIHKKSTELSKMSFTDQIDIRFCLVCMRWVYSLFLKLYYVQEHKGLVGC